MRDRIEAVIGELKRLKEEGVEDVYLEKSTLEGFKCAMGLGADAPTASKGASGRDKEGSDPTTMEAPRRNGKATAEGSLSVAPIPPPPAVTLPEGNRSDQWEWLREQVLRSKVCREHVRPGKKVVFGVGNIDAEIFFCGEAPGAEEEVEGEPFVGKAGQLLTRIIGAMNLRRSDVYIGNIMNWRPEMATAYGNRPPTQEEMNYCLPYLRAQLKIVEPKVIVALGKTAVSGLLGPDPNRRMGEVRGRWFEFESTPLMITYHPSYILRSRAIYAKRLIWEDMLKVMERTNLPITEKQRSYFLEQR